MISVPRPPAIPASLAAIVTLAGLGLMYWALAGLGLLKNAAAPIPSSVAPGGSGAGAVGSFGGGSAGTVTKPVRTPKGGTVNVTVPGGGGAGGGF